MLDADDQALLDQLLHGPRVLSLAVQVEGSPYAGLLPFVYAPELRALLVHASNLARHTRGLGEGARYAALVHAPDGPDADPLQLPRISFAGPVRRLERESAEWEAGGALYRKRFPGSAITFGLGDFNLYALEIESGRLVAGFARAKSFSPSELPTATA